MSGIRTSIFGKLMEQSYIDAQCESGAYNPLIDIPPIYISQQTETHIGKGSHLMKKTIMNGRLSDSNLFSSWSTKLRKGCSELSGGLRRDVRELVSAHLEVIRGTLDIIRDENAVLESERDPEFRERVKDSLTWAKEELTRVKAVVL
jgi:hypothetical protein